ncbi:MAG: DUF4388 domain-containing protein [Nitrospirota bacterium]
MSLEGSVGDFGIVDVFQMIGMQKKSGILTASCRGKETVSVFFLDGALIRAFSGDGRQRFADALLLSEKITVAQMRSAFRFSSEKTPIAETFIKLNYLTLEDAKHWTQILSEEALFHLLAWKEGTYQFEPEAVTQNQTDMSMNIESVLMEGMRQQDEWPQLLQKVPSGETVYEQVFAIEEDSTDYPETKEGKLLSFINGQRTVTDVVNYAGMGSFPVYKAFSDLISHGKIKPSAHKEAPKRFFPEISVDLIKRLLFNSAVFNAILTILTIGIASLFLYFLLFKGSFLFKQAEPFHELAIVNKKDKIIFLVNLYYLNHKRYPNSLEELKLSGLLEDDFPLENWHYSHDRSQFRLEFISLISE